MTDTVRAAERKAAEERVRVLTEALQRIAHGWDGDEFNDSADLCDEHRDIAREALAGEGRASSEPPQPPPSTYAIRHALEVLGDQGYDEDIRRAALAELDDLEEALGG